MLRLIAIFLLLATAAGAQQTAERVVFWEDGFPAVDSGTPTRAEVQAAFAGATLVNAEALPQALSQARTLVLPYGSAFPESAWPAIFGFLQRGGNLVAVGGRPFTRPAYRDAVGGWKVRDDNYAFAHALNITDYQQTASSAGTQFVANEDVLQLPSFSWKQAWSLVLRLSDQATSTRDGATGFIDARLTPLAWGEREEHKVAAPAVEIDHLDSDFAGGRWVFITADVGGDFWKQTVAGSLAGQAAEGASEFRVQVDSPLLLPGEPIEMTAMWRGFGAPPPSATIDLSIKPEHGEVVHKQVVVAATQWPVLQRIELPPSTGTGFHVVTAELHAGNRVAIYRTGFWMRDLAYLRSGPKLAVNADFFTVNGRTLPVMGTTYMASDAQRLYFAYPNPYVWDRDMDQIERAGLNMLRTGWWTNWNDLVEGGVASEHTLRTMEAFLMTARRHNFPVQWTLFAFMPEIFGGGNPYLNPEALRRETAFVTAVVERFHDVPFLAWDLINEPSFDNPKRLWQTRPNGDDVELAAWNEWLKKRYPDADARTNAWRALPSEEAPVPDEHDFSNSAQIENGHPVAAFDFRMFAQDMFVNWAMHMRTAIHDTGSQQLITVGQDEGGGTDRASPAFYAPALDFTTTHTWWLNDALLWDSLVAKVPGKAMLTQETGFQREWGIDVRPRSDTEREARVLERKIAIAMATGAGAIQWLWNVNSWMTSEQEVVIGAIRPDDTEKPEADVMRRFAKFAAAAGTHLQKPAIPEVAIVTSQTFQYSNLGTEAIEAQQRSVRVMNYDLHTPTYVITENNLDKLGTPKLVVLPSPQALTDAAWERLIAYVRKGGTLLMTGPAGRDDSWRRTQRLRQLGIDADAQPLVLRAGVLDLPGNPVSVQFNGQRQLTLESLRMNGGWAEKQIGNGTLLVAAFPVELAEGDDATRAVYAAALQRAHVKPLFDGQIPAGLLVRPVVFEDSVLYLLDSESAIDCDLDVKDISSGGRIRAHLKAGTAQLILLDRHSGRVLASSE